MQSAWQNTCSIQLGRTPCFLHPAREGCSYCHASPRSLQPAAPGVRTARLYPSASAPTRVPCCAAPRATLCCWRGKREKSHCCSSLEESRHFTKPLNRAKLILPSSLTMGWESPRVWGCRRCFVQRHLQLQVDVWVSCSQGFASPCRCPQAENGTLDPHCKLCTAQNPPWGGSPFTRPLQ